jgi:hypothetical protein
MQEICWNENLSMERPSGLKCGGCTGAREEAYYDNDAVDTGQARGSRIT